MTVKNRYRKIRYEEIVLLVVYMIVAFCGLFFGIYTQRRAMLSDISTCFYSSNAVSIRAATPVTESRKPDVQLLIDFVAQHPGVTIIDGSVKKNALGIGILSSRENFSLPVTSGQSITAADFAEFKEVSVYVKNFEGAAPPRVYWEDGKKFYENYEIIGDIYVPSSGIGSFLLQVITPEYKPTVSPLIIDAESAAQTRRAADDLKKLLEDDGFTVLELEITPLGSDITGFFGVRTLNLIVLAFSVLAVVAATVPVTLMWVKKRYREIAVRRLFGSNAAGILARVALRFFVLYNIGFFFAYLLAFVVISSVGGPAVPGPFSSEMVLAYAAGLAVNALTAVFPISRCMRIEPGDALRKV